MDEIFRDAITVAAGVSRTPAVDVPAGATWCNVSLSREAWPAAGATVAIVTSDGESWEVVHAEPPIGPGEPSPRTGELAPAAIGVGWRTTPAQVCIEVDSPEEFTATALIEVG